MLLYLHSHFPRNPWAAARSWPAAVRRWGARWFDCRQLTRGAWTILQALGLAACAAAQHYPPPDSGALAPAAFATEDAAVAADAPAVHWWVALGDPTLAALIERALADNPDLATAEARVQQARAQARIAGAAFYPSLDGQGRLSRDRLSREGENLALIPFTPSTTEFTDYRLGVDASWEIDLAGKTRRDVEAAVARLGSSVESRNDARLVVAADVANAYIDFHAGTLRLGFADSTLASFSESLRLTELVVRAGLSSEADRQRAAADRLAASAAVPPLLAQRQRALFELAALTGTPVETLAAELATPRTLPDVPTTTSVGLPGDLLRRRPDVRRAERDLEATTADVGSAVAAQFPRLSLLGDFGWDTVHAGDLIGAAGRYWNLTPQLTVPLFEGGRLRTQVKASEAARDAALGAYRATVLRALSDTETSIVRFASERHRAATLADALTALTEAADLERRRYAAGDTSKLELLAAERAAVQAADLECASRAELDRNYVALGKALGGGWQ
jgi:NodT family efflux transporter outer membrane factor (OMF) lipoprotein